MAVIRRMANGVQPGRGYHRHLRGNDGRINSLDNRHVVQSDAPCTLSRMDTEAVEHTCPITGLINFWDRYADATPVNITDGHTHQHEIVADMG